MAVWKDFSGGHASFYPAIRYRNTPSNCAPAHSCPQRNRMPHAPLSNTLQVLVDQRWLSVTAVAKGAAVKQPTLPAISG